MNVIAREVSKTIRSVPAFRKFVARSQSAIQYGAREAAVVVSLSVDELKKEYSGKQSPPPSEGTTQQGRVGPK